MDKKLAALNNVLLAMLGSQDLVDKWWKNPNKRWDGRTPDTIYLIEPQEVINYVLEYYQK